MTTLLFLGLNYAPEEIGIGLYSGELIDAWTKAGNDAYVVTAKPYYPQWKTWPGYGGLWSTQTKGRTRIIRCPVYIPAKPSGLRRIIHYATFAASSLFPMIARAISHKPDLVMTVAPSLIAAPVAWIASKISGAKNWIHIQDFEVEAASATGLVSESGPGMRVALAYEKWMLQRFDIVSTISPQMCRKLIEKGVDPDRIFELRNWADPEEITPQSEPSPYRTEWGVTTEHVLLYSGNIANKQGIEIVLEVARVLVHRDDLTFVICGEGPNRTNLEREAADLPNVLIRDLQPRERLSDLLGMATIHLLPQKAGAADLVLPSKLTNMLASGRPVVATAEKGTGLFDEVEGAGVAVPPGDAKAMAAAVESLIADADRRAALGSAARKCAEERWSRQAITQRFINHCAGSLNH